ncbi:MAG: oxidoreductase [Actinomycetota bacterium]
MGWFKPRRRSARIGSSSAGPSKADIQAASAHLKEFVRTRLGVEMYVEPQTSVTPTTVVLIATSGEWTRRRVSGPEVAGQLARDLGIPVYDVQQTGYPSRMREWTSQQRRATRDRPNPET